MMQALHYVQQQYYVQPIMPKSALSAPVATENLQEIQNPPYGRALNAARMKHAKEIQAYFSEGYVAASCKRSFRRLCRLRAESELPEEALWFEESVTHFKDGHEKCFVDFVRKLLET